MNSPLEERTRRL